MTLTRMMFVLVLALWYAVAMNEQNKLREKFEDYKAGEECDEIELGIQECAVCLEDVKIETPHFKAACGHLIHSACMNRPRRCWCCSTFAVNPRLRSVMDKKKNGAEHILRKKQGEMGNRNSDDSSRVHEENNGAMKKQNLYKESKTCCSICLDVLNGSERNFKWPVCGHEFHQICAKRWCEENNTCPNCRKSDPNLQNRANSHNRETVNRNTRYSRGFSILLLLSFHDLAVGNNCFVCNKPLRYSLRTAGHNEMCEECVVEESLQESRFRAPNRAENIGQRFGNACVTCNKSLPYNSQTAGRNEMCEECVVKESLEEIRFRAPTSGLGKNRNSRIQRNEEDDGSRMQMRCDTFSNVLNPNAEPRGQLNRERNQRELQNVGLKSQECVACLEDIKIETPHYKAACGHLVHSVCVNRPRRCWCGSKNKYSVNPRLRSVMNKKKNEAEHIRGKKQEEMENRNSDDSSRAHEENDGRVQNNEVNFSNVLNRNAQQQTEHNNCSIKRCIKNFFGKLCNKNNSKKSENVQ